MKLKFLMYFAVFMLYGVQSVSAQTAGDKLFLEGQRYQRTMTVASQNTAISKFTSAKVVYTTADKKAMCDNQIAVCRNNIKTINAGTTRKPDPTPKPIKKKKQVAKEEPKPEPKEEVPAKKARENVLIKASPTRLDFKYRPKKGETQSVEVTCNYDDWEIVSKPEWTTVYKTSDKISVEVEENSGEEERSGIITLKCDEKEAQVVVNQDRRKALNKIADKLGDKLKKKKK